MLIQLRDGLIDSHAPLITSQMSFPSWQALLIFLLLLLLLILGFQPAGAQSRATCPLLTFCILWSAFPWAKAFSYDPPSLALCHLAWRELSWCSCTCVSGHWATTGLSCECSRWLKEAYGAQRANSKQRPKISDPCIEFFGGEEKDS